MQTILLDVDAGEISAELVERGVPASARVRAKVEVLSRNGADQILPMAEGAQAGGAFDWLADEPDLYTDSDLSSGR